MSGKRTLTEPEFKWLVSQCNSRAELRQRSGLSRWTISRMADEYAVDLATVFDRSATLLHSSAGHAEHKLLEAQVIAHEQVRLAGIAESVGWVDHVRHDEHDIPKCQMCLRLAEALRAAERANESPRFDPQGFGIAARRGPAVYASYASPKYRR